MVARFEQKGWRDSGPWLAVGNDSMAGGLAAASVSDPAALDVAADLNDPRDRHDKALPAVHFPEDDISNLCHDSTGVCRLISCTWCACMPLCVAEPPGLEAFVAFEQHAVFVFLPVALPVGVGLRVGSACSWADACTHRVNSAR